MPLTDWKDRYEVAPWMVKIVSDNQNKLTKDSSADYFQIRSVEEERCIKKLGQVDNDTMEKIREGLAIVLNIK